MQKKWIRYVWLGAIFLWMSCSGKQKRQEIANQQQVANRDTLYASLSMQLLQTVRVHGNPRPIMDRLANASMEELEQSLDSPARKKAFWLNVYNAYIQILLGNDPELMKSRNDFFGYNFFSSPQVVIGGHTLSFDDIEHGIIRHSKIKWAMGYLDKWSWLVDDFEQRFRWSRVDPRVHFALNCGAASCPRIAIYDPDRVEDQLTITARQYLDRTTDYLPYEHTVRVTRLFSWFRGDFGGVDEVPAFLKRYGILPREAQPSVEFKPYDWTVDLGKFKDI